MEFNLQGFCFDIPPFLTSGHGLGIQPRTCPKLKNPAANIREAPTPFPPYPQKDQPCKTLHPKTLKPQTPNPACRWCEHSGLRGIAESAFGRRCEQSVLGALWNFPGSGPPVWRLYGIYACVCMYVIMYACMHACRHACLSVGRSVCLSVCMYVCIGVYIRIYIYIYRCAYIYIYICIGVHICVYVYVPIHIHFTESCVMYP